MARRNSREQMLLPKPPLLITESASKFEALRDALNQEVKPRGIIEQTYVHNISCIVWEILRLQRCKTVIINTGFRSALRTLLEQALDETGILYLEGKPRSETLSRKWFIDEGVKREVSKILSEYQLDISAVEAQAIRESLSALEMLDKMLVSLEARYDKALRCVAEYRDGLAQLLREHTDQIIEGKDILKLPDASSKKSAAA